MLRKVPIQVDQLAAMFFRRQHQNLDSELLTVIAPRVNDINYDLEQFKVAIFSEESIIMDLCKSLT